MDSLRDSSYRQRIVLKDAFRKKIVGIPALKVP